MLKNFEEYTQHLDENDKATARIVYKILRLNHPITNKHICEILKTEHNIKVGGPKIRKIINWMHLQGHLPNLVATSSGYSFAKSRQELLDYAESLKGRVSAIAARLERTLKDLNQYGV